MYLFIFGDTSEGKIRSRLVTFRPQVKTEVPLAVVIDQERELVAIQTEGKIEIFDIIQTFYPDGEINKSEYIIELSIL